MKISLGSDHRGYQVKERLKKLLGSFNIDYVDQGTFNEEPCDYPDFAKKVAADVIKSNSDFAILICGSGLGMSIAANRFKGVRAALCLTAEMAQMARKHNNANILVLSANFTEIIELKNILNSWLNSDFEGGRHEQRIRKIDKFN
jgi:ribose 5-phosphate isomerase B